MKTPYGKECKFYYSDYFRGRESEECRLIENNPDSDKWFPALCQNCPVPDILLANQCQHLRLYGRVSKALFGLSKKVERFATGISWMCKNPASAVDTATKSTSKKRKRWKTKSHMNSPYIVNGKTYNSIDEMPPDVRMQFESVSNLFADKDRNRIPDIMDNLMPAAKSTVVQTNTIVFDGKTYNSLDELPPEARAAYEKAIEKLADENKDGMPDLIADALKGAPTIVTTQVTVSGLPATTETNGGTPRPTPRPPTTTNLGPVIVLGIVAIGLVIIVLLALILILNKGL
jgi:hypothetical protein